MKLYPIMFFLFFLADHTPENLEENDIRVGMIIDKYNGVPVFYNGDVGNVSGRSKTRDGYNLGLKYQCVEYVKRYYYYRKDHKMNDSYGHAKEFFDPTLPDKKFNGKRGLYQFRNGSEYAPVAGDILIFDGNKYNPFGHIGIVTKSVGMKIEIIQQNVGKESRASYGLYKSDDKYYVDDADVLGWLRKA